MNWFTIDNIISLQANSKRDSSTQSRCSYVIVFLHLIAQRSEMIYLIYVSMGSM